MSDTHRYSSHPMWNDHVKPNSSAIMQSLDSLSNLNQDVCHLPFQPPGSHNNMSLHVVSSINDADDNELPTLSYRSILLIDHKERLRVSSSNQFLKRLAVAEDAKVKVVSIFGNTGDGKSYTINETFFNGEEVFRTSSEQSSCTLGVWAAYDKSLETICLDTEGFLGTTINENERTRLLLKVLAISDIVIYRTRSERLHRDLFTFLGAASRAYEHHFHATLQALGQKGGLNKRSSALGPSVIIFHETGHTTPLSNTGFDNAEDIIRNRFAQMKFEIKAFNSIKYVGIQTVNRPTNFTALRLAIQDELENTTIRSARYPHLVYETLKLLNNKFSGEINNIPPILFPDQYFTCPVKCLSCESRCTNSMGHMNEGIPHCSRTRCRYQYQYENQEYICKNCYLNGEDVVVTCTFKTQNETGWYSFAKYAWTGYVIECPKCGEIFRSRQYWYGNKDPEDEAVKSKIIHVWNITNTSNTNQNSAQRVIDGVSYITEAMTSASLQPAKAITSWVADQVAPAYWRPNHEIQHCHKCKCMFSPCDTKHHCRACGEGFCGPCSTNVKPVPTRNWHNPVRVCDDCFEKDHNYDHNTDTIFPDNVSVRKVSEQVVSTLSAVGSVLTYSKTFIKDTVRPSYWMPDSEVTNCCVCDKLFSDMLPLHHCRDCGRGVCDECSQNRKPVPRRGWDNPVRICDVCIKID